MDSSDGCPENRSHDHAVSLVGYGIETVTTTTSTSTTSSCRKATKDERRFGNCGDGNILQGKNCCTVT